MNDIRKPTTSSHYKKFEELLEGNKRALSAASKELGTCKAIKERFKEDKNLNTIPSHLFNKHFVLDSKEYSLSQNISLIKHYLIFHYIKAEPVFMDQQHLYKVEETQVS